MGDHFARFAFLVLSGLATFAILASIDTAVRRVGPLGLASGQGADTLELENQVLAGSDWPPDTGVAPSPVPDAAAPVGGRPAAGQATATRAERRLGEIAKWLEALTYAVLALAGFAAAGLVVLIRIAARR